MAVAVLLLLLGVFVLARTFTHDAQHRNLVDRIMDLG